MATPPLSAAFERRQAGVHHLHVSGVFIMLAVFIVMEFMAQARL
jgi:hypothetical protein